MKIKKPKKYFLSFVEEGIFNPEYADCVGGRLEITDCDDQSGYAETEVRFFTRKVDSFRAFREKWDMKDVGKARMEQVSDMLTEHFNDGVST